MKRKLLTALLVSGCSATLLAQSAIEGGSSNPDSSFIPNGQFFGIQPDSVNSSSGIMSMDGIDCVGGFTSALVASPYIHLNGSDIIVDSFQPTTIPGVTNIPEPGSGLTLLLGTALVAWFGLRRTSPA